MGVGGDEGAAVPLGAVVADGCRALGAAVSFVGAAVA